MKYRTYTRLLALALSLTLLTACGPKGESGSQSNPDGSVSSSQGSVSTPDASQPDLSLPESSQPDASQPDASQPNKDQGDSSKPQVEEPAVKKSLSLNSSDFSLFKAGAAYQLKAESKPEKGTYTWTSDNEAVATVSNKGLVTAVAPGTATVTVTDSKTGLSASCIVRCKFGQARLRRRLLLRERQLLQRRKQRFWLRLCQHPGQQRGSVRFLQHRHHQSSVRNALPGGCNYDQGRLSRPV